MKYSEYWGDRIAWKIGDLTAEEPYGRRSGQFSVNLDINIDSGTFKQFAHKPFRTIAEFDDHSLSVMFWRWGFWVAIRGRKQ